MEKEEIKESQLKDTTVFLMIGIALFCDFLQALIGWIPLLGNILADLMSIFIFLTFFLWFYMNGIKMVTPKRLSAMVGGSLVEMVPYLNLFPAWTGVVIYLIGTTKIKEIAAKHPTLAKGALAAGGKIKSMNRNKGPSNTPPVEESTKLENTQTAI